MRKGSLKAAQCVDEIVDEMAAGKWVARASHRAKAKKWGIGERQVGAYASEASRVLRREYQKDEELRTKIRAMLDRISHMALADRQYVAAVKALQALGEWVRDEEAPAVKAEATGPTIMLPPEDSTTE